MSSTGLPSTEDPNALEAAAPGSPIAALQQRYRTGETTPLRELETALGRSNSNLHRNVYLAQDAAWSRHEASRLGQPGPGTFASPDGAADRNPEAQPLWGVPVSLKDCFDLAGFPTSCGSLFYRERNGIAAADSDLAARLRRAGAVLTGKTHLHQLAFGITGESRDFGDCLQPRDASLLTGGSSSGAAASVQEGSALAAIGTDTGGSIRVPAALCGLAGYRSSITLSTEVRWRGGAHLAETFDTIGWIYRDLRDGPLLGHALFGLGLPPAPDLAALRVSVPGADFLHDCEPGVLANLQRWQSLLERNGVTFSTFDTSVWDGVAGVFGPIQAYEAAQLHEGYFQHFEPAIAERLAWGASFPAAEIAMRRNQLADFRATMDRLFEKFDYLLLPCTPAAALRAGEDHFQTRARLLRYTAPAALAGLPTVALPGEGGLQLVGRCGSDATLLAVSAALGRLAPAAAAQM